TTARTEDGHFVINGQKIWTSSAHYADMMFLLCRTEFDKGKHDGLSYLLVPMSTPGIEVRPLVTMTGRAEFNETFFTNVRVPVDQIVLG
ncbi:acyl-CoA dehydrogenase family protein, partial [Klebsiella pneumoniae]|uniref:acyl-CoA dehydrogenase family protein n=1 Tax=Klebsiella pneumoniae TaxID=573 RepID=UPI001953E112